jgi:hypothetical protein
MKLKITRDILESYILCEYNSYLKLEGLHGEISDYERLIASLTREVGLITC